MPCAMIHLLTARCVPGRGGPLYLLGSLAPDYIHTRREKDLLHLRLEQDRPEALKRLARGMDPEDPFQAGWLVHLLADLRWDTLVIPSFRASLPPEADWFPLYRQESHRAGYALYHSLPWSREAMEAVLAADLNALPESMDLDREALEEYRRALARKHAESPADSASSHFPPELLMRFARETAEDAMELLAPKNSFIEAGN